MSVKTKIKDFFKKLGKRTKDAVDANAARADDPTYGAGDIRKSKTDAEASLEEVVHEEIYPEKKRCHNAKAKTRRTSAKTRDAEFAAEKPCKKKTKSASGKKPPSKRTRPTNPNYRMINPDDDTCDTGKS